MVCLLLIYKPVRNATFPFYQPELFSLLGVPEIPNFRNDVSIVCFLGYPNTNVLTRFQHAKFWLVMSDASSIFLHLISQSHQYHGYTILLDYQAIL